MSTRPTLPDTIERPAPASEPTSEVYDRSSLRGNYLVMIAGQTEEDFFRLAPEKQFCEFIDGIVYMPSPISIGHQRHALFLAFLLNGFQSAQMPLEILLGPAVLKLRNDCNLEPDVFVLPAHAEGQIFENYATGPALLVIEILSPSNRSHDLVTKAALYREAMTAEVWFVDGRDRVLIADRRVGEGYQTERIASGPCVCAALPGFWINVDWLWADPQPNAIRCLEAILAGPPA